MNFGGILIEARRHRVLGFLERHAVHMVDLLADLVIAPLIGRAGKRIVIGGDVERGTLMPISEGSTRSRQLRHHRFRRRRVLVPLRTFAAQRMYLRTTSPFWFRPVERHVDELPISLFEFLLRPYSRQTTRLSTDSRRASSPRSRRPRRAVPLAEIGDGVGARCPGTVLPNTTWKEPAGRPRVSADSRWRGRTRPTD